MILSSKRLTIILGVVVVAFVSFIVMGRKDNASQVASELNLRYSDSDFTNEVLKVDGNFARGTAVVKDGGGQYAWIAVKDISGWKIVSNYTEKPTCAEMAENKVPATFYIECE